MQTMYIHKLDKNMCVSVWCIRILWIMFLFFLQMEYQRPTDVPHWQGANLFSQLIRIVAKSW
jgi:hypothetical protein